MTARKPQTKLSLVQPDLEQMEAVVAEAAQQVAPITSRYTAAQNEVQMKRNILMREYQDFVDHRSLLRAQFEAADAGLMAHQDDINLALGLFPASTRQGE